MNLQGTFSHNGKNYTLSLTEEGLTWYKEGNESYFHKVLSHEIVSCWICPSGSLSCACGTQTDIKECKHSKKGRFGLSLEIGQRKEGGQWSLVVHVFLHCVKDVVLIWHNSIWTTINGLVERPRRLLVIINPVGGRRKGVHNFRKKVAPLFHRARIQTSEVQTKFKGHGIRLVQEALASQGFLTKYDGLVAVGGDGLVSEMATGLFLFTCSYKGISPHDFQTDLPFTELRIGIIPSGSTDATCFATHGSSDIITAALHIIMGDRKAVDVAAVHYDGQLQRVVTSLVSYGYFGDLMRSSERLRCLGPPRYMLSGVQQIFRNRSYPVHIKVRKKKSQAGDDGSGLPSSLSCNSICSVCDIVDGPSPSSSSEEWEEVNGKFSVVSAAVTSCACRLTPQGVSPLAHLGDGYSDLILVDGSSRAKLLSYLYHTGVTGSAADLRHVRMIRTNEMHFSTSAESHSVFNCDGEELKPYNLSIKVHRQKLAMFCRGVEKPLQLSVHKTKGLETVFSKFSTTSL